MSIINVIVKTIAKVIYGIIQLIGILGEGVSKLSTTVNDNLMNLDEKLTNRFEKKATE